MDRRELAAVLVAATAAVLSSGVAYADELAQPLVGGTAIDAAINGKVAAALMSDPGLMGARIDVDTQDGVVRLKGTVVNATETLRALQLAADVEGVRQVDNQLEVLPAR